jgi:hypothetical protein
MMRGITGLVAFFTRHAGQPSARLRLNDVTSSRVRPRHVVAAVAVAGLLAGCAAPRPAPPAPVTTASASPAPVVRTPGAPVDTVMLVGKIEVAPPLERSAQASRAGEDYRNQAQLLFSERPSVLDTSEAPTTVVVTVGEYFFVPYKRTKALYYSGGVVGRSPFRINGYGGAEFVFGQPELRLMGTFRVDLKPGDRALYLGTFRYARDTQGMIKVRRIDDYKRAQAEFEQRHGRSDLRQALLRPID